VNGSLSSVSNLDNFGLDNVQVNKIWSRFNFGSGHSQFWLTLSQLIFGPISFFVKKNNIAGKCLGQVIFYFWVTLGQPFWVSIRT